MNRFATALVVAVTAGAALSGCSGDSPYCKAVKDNQTVLKTFGAKATDAVFGKEAAAVREIAATRPETAAKDWATLDKTMRAVLAAQKKAGITFDGLADAEKRAEVSTDDLDAIDEAYEAFNQTAEQRTAIAADVQKTCGVSLSPDEKK